MKRPFTRKPAGCEPSSTYDMQDVSSTFSATKKMQFPLRERPILKSTGAGLLGLTYFIIRQRLFKRLLKDQMSVFR